MRTKLQMTREQLGQVVTLAKDNESLDIDLLVEAMGLTVEEVEIAEEAIWVDKSRDSQRAYDETIDWIAINQSKFTGTHSYETYGEIRDGYIYIVRAKFNKFMEESGYSNRAVLSEWSKKGLIKTYREPSTGKTRFDNPLRTGEQITRFICLKVTPQTKAVTAPRQADFNTYPNNNCPWAEKVEKKTDSRRAYDDTLDWIADNRDKFDGKHPDEIYGEITDDCVFVLYSVLFKFMEENGYSSRAILSEWAKDGLVRVYPETSLNEYNRYYSRRRMGLNGRMIRCICLKITPKVETVITPKQIEFNTDRHPYRNARWAKHEADLLKEELIKFGEPRKVPQESIRTLSELTGRTESAVKTKLYDLHGRKGKQPTGRRRWRPREDKELLRLYEETDLSVGEIAKKLGRTTRAVDKRRRLLSQETRSGQWTRGEEDKLIRLYEGTGMPLWVIGKELRRTESAVTYRIKKLRNEGRITTYRVAPEGASNENRNQNK